MEADAVGWEKRERKEKRGCVDVAVCCTNISISISNTNKQQHGGGMEGGKAKPVDESDWKEPMHWRVIWTWQVRWDGLIIIENGRFGGRSLLSCDWTRTRLIGKEAPGGLIVVDLEQPGRHMRGINKPVSRIRAPHAHRPLLYLSSTSRLLLLDTQSYHIYPFASSSHHLLLINLLPTTLTPTTICLPRKLPPPPPRPRKSKRRSPPPPPLMLHTKVS